MFNSSKIFRWGKIHDFMDKNKIKQPTDHAILLGGELISQGHKVIFECPISNMHTDLYVPTLNEKIFIEVVGDIRTKEQLIKDRNRDAFLSCEGFTVLRFNNEKIENYVQDQINKYFLGINAFEKHLNYWRLNGIPKILTKKEEQMQGTRNAILDLKAT
ncbi:DUF559 domain-containing protein [Peribacillus sp. FSL H8-0477]|uniref:DUF559 domain-containing protein n=1 Tax=Peribacillus sp. FSL H8-0477 TaxID=2921388 RepID=UPI0030FCBAA4